MVGLLQTETLLCLQKLNRTLSCCKAIPAMKPVHWREAERRVYSIDI